MNLDWYLTQLLARSVEALPWLVGGLFGLGVFSWSPLGRGLIGHLRSRRTDAAVNEQLLRELEELRQLLGDVTERLDFAERKMAQERLGFSGLERPDRALPQPPASTPH